MARQNPTGPKALRPPQLLLVALPVLALAAFIAFLRTNPGLPRQSIDYNIFEDKVRERYVERVWLGDSLVNNPIVLKYSGEETLYYTIAPSTGRAVDLLLKNQVPIEPLRRPALSGFSWPVAVALLVPYLILSAFLYMLLRAAGAAVPAPPDEEPLVECPGCKERIPASSHFCPRCAHPVQWTGTTLQCPGCGGQVWKSDRHCRSCGRRLAEPGRSRPAPAARPRSAEPPAAEAAPAGAAPPAPEPDGRNQGTPARVSSRPPTPGPPPEPPAAGGSEG